MEISNAYSSQPSQEAAIFVPLASCVFITPVSEALLKDTFPGEK